MASDDFALLIGIAHYPKVRNLKGPLNDVQVIDDWLQKPGGGNVPITNIQRIVSDPNTPGPDLAAITGHLTNFMNAQAVLGKPPPLGRLYLFFNGHGIASPVLSQVALCMADSDISIPLFPHLGGQMYADDLGNRGLFKEVFMWMDCCRQVFNANFVINGTPFPPVIPPSPPDAFFWGFATPTGSLAAEARVMIDGVKRHHGVFTALFMEGVQNCPARQNGDVFASDLANYVHNNATKFIATGARPQFVSSFPSDIRLFNRLAGAVPAPAIPASSTAPTPGLQSVSFFAPGVAPASLLEITTGSNVVVMTNLPLAGDRATANLAAGIYKAAIQGTPRSQLFAVPPMAAGDVTL